MDLENDLEMEGLEIKKHHSYNFEHWKINSFKDVIKYNVEFLKGIRLSSPYHAAPVYDMKVENLITINENGIVTINGQSNECVYNKYVPQTKHVYYFNDRIERVRVSNSIYYFMEQKSYLDSFIKLEMMDELINFIDGINNDLGNEIVLYKFCNLNGVLTSNYKTDKNWLTRKYASKYEINDLSEIKWEYPHNDNLNDCELFSDTFNCKHIKGIINFMLIIDEPCYNKFTCEDILINFIKKEFINSSFNFISKKRSRRKRN